MVEGTADLDARFFQPHGHLEPSPFAITVALLSSSSMVPLDWNQEEPSQCGLIQSTPNPNSRITIHPRITVDAELCCVSFSIAIPFSVLTASSSQTQYQLPPTQSTATRAIVSGSLWREFGVAVKAYDAGGKVTQTNIAQFLVRYPKASAMTGQSTANGLARRVSQAINMMGRRRRSSNKQYPGDLSSPRGRQLRKRSVHSVASNSTKASR